jgi:hypothetical protein
MKPEIEPFPEVLKTLPDLKIRLSSPENWHGKEGPPYVVNRNYGLHGTDTPFGTD